MSRFFTVQEAQDLVQEAQEGVFLSKGKIIDIIRSTARKGQTSVEIVGLSEKVSEELSTIHGFSISGNLISWEQESEN